MKLSEMKNGILPRDGNYYDKNNMINLRDMHLTKLPNDLPEECIGAMYITGNNLTSLKGSPKKSKDFYCGKNRLASLVGGPTEITGNFGCSFANQLDDLTGAPVTVGKNFRCNRVGLKSLKGAPKFVGGEFECTDNQLTSLHNIHLYLPQVKQLILPINPITSHVLGVLKIKGCVEIRLDNDEVQNILNKYLPEGDLIDCQEELIEAGYPEYAQL